MVVKDYSGFAKNELSKGTKSGTQNCVWISLNRFKVVDKKSSDRLRSLLSHTHFPIHAPLNSLYSDIYQKSIAPIFF